MASVSSSAVRRAPQQDRSARRLATFLEAAADLVAEVGFEAATMTVIAERSGASIGALYHYFPDKKSIALALLNQYRQEIEGQLKPLLDQAAGLTHDEFADRFLERVTGFLEERPAYVKLQAAPIKLSRAPAAKRALRGAFAAAFRVKNPSLSEDRALLAAKIALALAGDMMALYAEAGPRERPMVSAEFKRILALYLADVLNERAARA
jgi:AcrR family transcriptional regulator